MKQAIVLADPCKARCVRALEAHRRRAAREGRHVPYRLADLEALARSTVQCRWCGALVAWDFHFDHVEPTSRGGGHELANLAISCSRCNLLKGQLDGDEMTALLAFLASLSPVAAEDIRRRLLHGGRLYARGRRRP